MGRTGNRVFKNAGLRRKEPGDKINFLSRCGYDHPSRIEIDLVQDALFWLQVADYLFIVIYKQIVPRF